MHEIIERWAVEINGKDFEWVDIIKLPHGSFSYDWPQASNLLLPDHLQKPARPVKSIGMSNVERAREFAQKNCFGPDERAVWFGPFPASTDIFSIKPEAIRKKPRVDTNTTNLAFRLEYKDKVFNLDAAIRTAQSFVHDSILAATNAPHEELHEVQITVTFNKPDQKRTKLVVAKEGDAWPLSEQGFKNLKK